MTPSDDLPEAFVPEFSLVVSLADIGDKAKTFRFKPSDEERAAIAARLDLLSLTRFEGEGRVRPWRKAGLVFEGRFIADLTQACVVTLEPVADHLELDFVVHYLPQDMIDEWEKKQIEDGDIIIDSENDEPVDPIVNGMIDVGESAVQQLALSINPYPRKPDASFEPPASAAAAKENPFAVLEKLKKTD